jgi:hypothetical protein
MYPSYFDVDPVTWRIAVNDAQGVLLIADQILDNKPWHNASGTVTWQNSWLRNWLENDFYQGAATWGTVPTITNYFSTEEKAAVIQSTLQNPTVGFGSDPDGTVTADHVFLLEAADSVYFSNAADRKAYNTQYAASYENTSNPFPALRDQSDAAPASDVWWMRTHSTGPFPGFSSYVQLNGYVNLFDGLENHSPFSIRPALRLSRDAVVMFSDNAKPSATGATLAAVAGATSDTLKLTLVSGALTLASSDAAFQSVSSPGSFTVNYTGLTVGAGRYISCVLEQQNGNALYYGKLDAASSASGAAKLNIPSSLASGAYTLKVFCEEPNTDKATPDLASQPVVFNLTVGSIVPPVITAPAAGAWPDGYEGVAQTTTVTASGTPAPVFSISAGALPTGLTLNPTTGVIAGIPTLAGPYAFSVTATNGGGSNTKAYTLDILTTVAPAITSPAAGALPDGVVDTSYINSASVGVTVMASGTPAPTFSLYASTLPAGLTVNPTTGVISGIPTTAGNVTFTVQASNAIGSDTRTFSININALPTPTPPVLITVIDTLPIAYANMAYAFHIEAAGIPNPVYSISNVLPSGGALPALIAFDPLTGMLSGMPDILAAGTETTFDVTVTNAAGSATRTYVLPVAFTLNPPHLTLTPPITTIGSDPFTVTATFNTPVSGLNVADIQVTGGTVSGLTMTNPTGASPVRSDIWTFNVTPSLSNVDGAVLEAFIRQGAATDANGAHTWRESDTVYVTYHTDFPVVSFGFADGIIHASDPGGFVFDITPYGSGASANSLYVSGAPLSASNIAGAIEIRRNGSRYTGWSATLSGNHVVISGIFGQGAYTVSVLPGRLSNNLGKFAQPQTIHFSVQVSKNWYEGCTQLLTVSGLPATAADRTLAITYTGLAADYVTTADGAPKLTQVTLPAGQTEITLSCSVLRLPAEKEGAAGVITVTDPASAPVSYTVFFYNRPRVEDVVYIPVTVMYRGFFKLLKGGSPYLQRSLDGGRTYANAWADPSGIALQHAEDAIILREPDGCYELVIPIHPDIDVHVQREIVLPSTPHVTTTPDAGKHYVSSGADFVFTVTPTGPAADLWPHVTTDRQHVPDSIGTIVTDNGNGTYDVRIRGLRESIGVNIRMGERPTTGNQPLETAAVWTSDGYLYIVSALTGEAHVYASTGAWTKTIPLTAGQTVRSPLPQGFYIIALPDGSKTKVINK